MSKRDRKFLVLSVLGRYVLSLIMGWIMLIGYIIAYSAVGDSKAVINLIFGFCALAMAVLLHVDMCQKKGEIAKKNVTVGHEKPCENLGLFIGMIATIPCYVTAIITVLAKIGVIGNFWPLYKLFNPYFVPLLNLFGNLPKVSQIGIGQIIMMFVLPLFFPLASWISFKAGYNGIDLKEKIVYKKD